MTSRKTSDRRTVACESSIIFDSRSHSERRGRRHELAYTRDGLRLTMEAIVADCETETHHGIMVKIKNRNNSMTDLGSATARIAVRIRGLLSFVSFELERLQSCLRATSSAMRQQLRRKTQEKKWPASAAKAACFGRSSWATWFGRAACVRSTRGSGGGWVAEWKFQHSVLTLRLAQTYSPHGS
ncbi:hypothetical protein BC830DRAFT_94968 [Chytriomyces sp. MP71]|nr:hypothetical protein BC830DRAFT_94968 [Chytriomyces sp. MP71]